MLLGVELVMDKESKKPAKEAAEILTYKWVQMISQEFMQGMHYNYCKMLIPIPPFFSLSFVLHQLYCF